jgi:hypothetical protein
MDPAVPMQLYSDLTPCPQPLVPASFDDVNNNNAGSERRNSGSTFAVTIHKILNPYASESKRFQLNAPLNEYQRKSYRTENR